MPRLRETSADQDQSGRWRLPRFFLPRLPIRFSDLAVGVVAAGAAAAILINALARQPGPHPAPFFGKAAKAAAEPTTGSVVTVLPRPRPPELEAARAAAAAPRPRAFASATKGTGATAEATSPSKQLAAVQRALADFGYGQIKPSGVGDADTRAAIEKFERERKLPVTGQLSDRVLRELAAMTGRALN